MANSTPEISFAPVTLSLRLPANPTQSYLAFYMYGVMLMAAQIGMIMVFSMSIHEDFRAGFFRQGLLIALVQTMVFYTLPAFLLSGYIWPEVDMTEIIRWVSMLQPVHYVLTDFRILSLTGVAPQINQHAAILFAIGSVSFVLLYGFLFFDERPSVTSEIF